MQVYCKICYVYQEWKGQSHCVNPNCGNRLSAWHIAGQLQAQEMKREQVLQNPVEDRRTQ